MRSIFFRLRLVKISASRNAIFAAARTWSCVGVALGATEGGAGDDDGPAVATAAVDAAGWALLVG
jgi:hypothetical protein